MKPMRQIVHSPLQLLIIPALCLSLVGCGSSVKVVDLNQVLDIMVATLQSGEGEAADKAVEASNEQLSGFMEAYAAALNAAPLMESTTMGVGMLESGTFVGYQDDNGDGNPQGTEQQIFTVEVDEIDENTVRLVATDLQGGYTRDSNPIARMGTGLLAGMMISSMLNRRSAAGISKSKYRGKQMSPKNYHAKAVSSAKARARAGSRSFKGGK